MERKDIGEGLTTRTLVVMNALIIAAAETTGTFFHETALIHGFALMFIVLAAARVFRRYDVYDPELRIYLRYGLASMAVFAVSHLVELFSIVVLKNYTDVTYTVAIDMYAISLLLLMAGGASLNRNLHKTTSRPIVAAWTWIAALAIFSFALLLGRWDISLEPEHGIAYVYAIGLSFLAGIAITQAFRIAREYVGYASFFNRMIAVTLLVAAAAFQYVFYEAIESLGVPEYRIIYLSHYFFYAALSAMYLAFGASLRPRGVFDDVRKFLAEGVSPLEKKVEKW
ncbi:MAG TPA: hypothetical protein VJ694_04300 [Patescibacteria group bacterium]|nr:hypothetical protein [Patescibacteria group bacterium]